MQDIIASMLYEWFTLINIDLTMITASSFTIEFPHSDSLGIYNDSSTARNSAEYQANYYYYGFFFKEKKYLTSVH